MAGYKSPFSGDNKKKRKPTEEQEEALAWTGYRSPFGNTAVDSISGYRSPFIKASSEEEIEEEERLAYEEAERQAIEEQSSSKKEPEKKKKGLADTIGSLFAEKTGQLVNLAGEGARGAAGLAQIGKASVFGSDEDYERRVAEVHDNLFGEAADERNREGGVFRAGTGFDNAEEINDMDGGRFAKEVTGRGLGVASEVVPFGRGYQLATNAAKGAKTASRIARGVAEGAAMGGVAGTANELLDEDGFQATGIIDDVVAGGAMGGAGGALGAYLSRGSKAVKGADDAVKPITDESRLLGTGEDWRASRLAEIDDELAYYQGRESTFNPENGSSYSPSTAGSETLETGGKLRADGTRDMRTNQNKRAGSTDPRLSETAQTKSPDELRALMKERKQLEAELGGINSVQHEATGGQAKMDMDDPVQRKVVENEAVATQSALEPVDMPTRSSSIVDYARVPAEALRRIGLGKTADLVEKSFETYRRSDVDSGRMIKSWREALGDDDAAKRIFHSLDGKDVALSPQEQAIRNDIRSYLDKYADDLGLTEDKRVSEYITHVFNDVIDGKSVDASFRTIGGNPGRLTANINDPYLKSRTSDSQNYSDDLWNVLDVYTKRANRKIHMEPAVKAISGTHAAVNNIDGKTARYLEKLHDSITLKPSRIDEIFNDAITSIPGVRDKFGAQAGTEALKAWRTNVYRATLGLNFGSALRNVTQLTNTFAEVPAKDFGVGMSQMLRSLGNRAKGSSDDFYDELLDMGILDDAIHKQDIDTSRLSMSNIRNGMQKVDKGLFMFFNTAEKLNRGATYAAGKSHAIRKLKMSEDEARKYASDLVSKTQFKFNSIETPLMFNSQVGKTLTQFTSYPVRQAGYMGKAVKGAVRKENGDLGLNPKEIAKIVKWTGANLAMAATMGEALGFDFKDVIPNLTGLRDMKSPTSQFLMGGDNKTGLFDVVGGKDAYGNTPTLKDENDQPILDDEGNPLDDKGALIRDFAGDQFGLVVPGGAQLKKSYEGNQTANRGTSETAGGGIRYETGDNALQSTVFGQYSTPEAREFYSDDTNRALSAKQSDLVREKDPILRGEYINFFRTLQKTPTKKDAIGKKVDKAIENKEFEKARRLAADHNAKIKTIRDDLVESVGGRISPELEEYISSQYMVNYDYYRNKKRK